MCKYIVEWNRRMRIARWIPEATNTYSEYVILNRFSHCNNGRTNATQGYVIRALPVIYLYSPVLHLNKELGH
jgi:hypothetical protein